jgi:hypothetical protein
VIRSALLLAGIALLGGCATVPPESCEQFEQARGATRYDTVYRYSEADTQLAAKSFAPARRAELVAARWYTLRTNRAQIRGCDHLYLTKDLYLLRGDTALALHEQREFYTADGRLIATKREDVTNQLKSSGFYSASVPLPIPKEAPPGAYRIVTRLIAKFPEGDRTLATTSAEFRVQP